MYPGLTSYGFIFSGWSLPASYPSLVLVHRHFISLGKQWPHVRFKRLVAGVEHTHPQHSAIHRVRHQLIQGGEVVVARDLAAVSRADGRERGGIAEERVKRLLADADVQAKGQRTVEVRELVIDIAGHKCHKRKPVIRRYVTIRVVEEEAVARSDHHIHTVKCPVIDWLISDSFMGTGPFLTPLLCSHLYCTTLIYNWRLRQRVAFAMDTDSAIFKLRFLDHRGESR